jgi:hypothetical protein
MVTRAIFGNPPFSTETPITLVSIVGHSSATAVSRPVHAAMRLTLIASSGLLAVAATVPYLFDILRGRTKPRIVSWLVWSVLVGVGSAAAFRTHQLPAAILSLCDMLACLLVVCLSYKRGARAFARLDIVCLCGALAAITAWGLVSSPALAVALVVFTDFLGAIPTLGNMAHVCAWWLERGSCAPGG